jgi:hypothetical protein
MKPLFNVFVSSTPLLFRRFVGYFCPKFYAQAAMPFTAIS